MKLVPNRFPLTTASHRIAIIGECPGGEEEQYGEPFIGPAGHILRNLLNNSSIHPDSVLLANVCNFRPPNNYLSAFRPDSPEMQTSRIMLKEDITRYDPHLCVLLGDYALKAAGEHVLKIGEARGTFFICRDADSPFYGRKCISSYNPAAVIRQWAFAPLLRLDLAKARRQGESPTLSLPEPTLDIYLSPTDVCDRLRQIQIDKHEIALDIEGDVNNITCYSIATSPDYAFAVDLSNYTDDDQIAVMKLQNEINRDPEIGKILQNALYDNFALTYRYGALIRNVTWDTMLSGWEIYPELPKNLGTQASIWTDFPAYKQQRKVKDWSVHLRYCCTDSVVTYAIKRRHEQVLKGSSLDHFKLNMRLLNVLLYMELRGTRYDAARAASIAGRSIDGLRMINDRINLIAGKSVNINSPKQLCDLLYSHLRYERQYSKDENGGRGGLSTGIDAILNIQKKSDGPVLNDILAYRKLDKIRTFAEIKSDTDGRVRCSYNAVGTETGRLSCYTSQLGTGTNLQTITKKLRGLYLADPDHYYFQIDLAGADGWTVAAHCARLGDRTMLDDYNFGLKPAKIIALLHQHGAEVNTWTRDQLKLAGKSIGDGETEWLYFACKRVQHGCVTAGHEVLTHNGWIPIEQLKQGTPIMCYDHDTRNANFETPSKLTDFLYTGTLHNFKGTAFDLTVTHDHRMPFIANNKAQCKMAHEVINSTNARYPISGNYVGGQKSMTLRQAMQVAAIHCDGCYTDSKLVFHFKKQRKVERIQYLFSNKEYKLYNNADGSTIIELARDQVEELFTYGKFAGAYLYEWPLAALKAYIEELPFWDGHVGSTNSTNVSSATQSHIEWINTFTHLIGKGGNMQKPKTSGFGSTIYHTQINNRTLARNEALERSTAPAIDVPVYCVTVPSSYFFVRRNGKIMVTGNTNYGLGARTMSGQILKDGFKYLGKTIIVAESVCKNLQRLYNTRYPGVGAWQAWIKNQLLTTQTLHCASGHVRRFFGRPNDIRTIQAAYSHEPQANTTYATNRAMLALWDDSENRHSNGSLIIEPLHQVHDAINGQFPIDRTEWAVSKLRTYMSNPLTIAGMSITIPYDGAYALSWGDCDSNYGTPLGTI